LLGPDRPSGIEVGRVAACGMDTDAPNRADHGGSTTSTDTVR